MTTIDKEEERKSGLVPTSVTNNTSISTYKSTVNTLFTSFNEPLPAQTSDSESITGTTTSTNNNQHNPTDTQANNNNNLKNKQQHIQFLYWL
jgi:hypothetical protein